jgi:hypothetical protein
MRSDGSFVAPRSPPCDGGLRRRRDVGMAHGVPRPRHQRIAGHRKVDGSVDASATAVFVNAPSSAPPTVAIDLAFHPTFNRSMLAVAKNSEP